eukprot:jgi/Botrbrau1/23247/Bobra.0041s0083.1
MRRALRRELRQTGTRQGDLRPAAVWRSWFPGRRSVWSQTSSS